jgi:hypothetical protein
VDQALNHAFKKYNIKFGFKAIGIWTYNPRAIDNKNQHLNICTITSKNEGGEEDCTLVHHTTKDPHSIRIETNQHYYVDMFLNHIMIRKGQKNSIW